MNRPTYILGAASLVALALILTRPKRAVEPLTGTNGPTPSGTQRQARQKTTNQIAPSTSTPVSTSTNEWSAQVEAVRASEEPDPVKAVRLLALFSSLPDEGKSEVIPELAAMTPDNAYSSISGILTDSTSPEDVLGILFTDLLDRPAEVQLPTLLELAKSSQHPKAADALEILGIQLGEDFGTDWDAWAKKISERLTRRPE